VDLDVDGVVLMDGGIQRVHGHDIVDGNIKRERVNDWECVVDHHFSFSIVSKGVE